MAGPAADRTQSLKWSIVEARDHPRHPAGEIERGLRRSHAVVVGVTVRTFDSERGVVLARARVVGRRLREQAIDNCEAHSKGNCARCVPQDESMLVQSPGATTVNYCCDRASVLQAD